MYIATTPDTHRELALRTVKAGKHCYLEKPVAHSYIEGEEIGFAFKAAGKKIFVAHYRRALPKTKTLKELIEKISPIRSVRVFRSNSQKKIPRWRGDPAISGGGVFFETDVHLVDLLDELFGPLLSWKLDAAGVGGMEDCVSLIARGRGNIFINGLWVYGAYKSEDICVVTGDNGILSFQGMDTGGIALIETSEGMEEITFPDEPHVGMPMEQTIVDELLGRGMCSSTLDSAMRAFKICCDMRDAVLA